MLSAHIFFDDAFQAHGDEEFEYTINNFVKQLVRVVDEAARFVGLLSNSYNSRAVALPHRCSNGYRKIGQLVILPTNNFVLLEKRRFSLYIDI